MESGVGPDGEYLNVGQESKRPKGEEGPNIPEARTRKGQGTDGTLEKNSEEGGASTTEIKNNLEGLNSNVKSEKGAMAM